MAAAQNFPQDDHLSHLSPPGDGSNSVPVPVRRNLAKGRLGWLVAKEAAQVQSPFRRHRRGQDAEGAD